MYSPGWPLSCLCSLLSVCSSFEVSVVSCASPPVSSADRATAHLLDKTWGKPGAEQITSKLSSLILSRYVVCANTECSTVRHSDECGRPQMACVYDHQCKCLGSFRKLSKASSILNSGLDLLEEGNTYRSHYYKSKAYL